MRLLSDLANNSLCRSEGSANLSPGFPLELSHTKKCYRLHRNSSYHSKHLDSCTVSLGQCL